MPGLVHAVADGDRERAEVVGAHLRLWSMLLHGHHTHLLSIAERVLTGPEWRELGKGRADEIQRNVRLAVFGMFLADADPDAAAMMVSHLPWSARG